MQLADMLQRYTIALQDIYSSSETSNITCWVLEDTLGISQLQLGFQRHMVLTYAQQMLLEDRLARLLQHEPVQYVLGHAPFMDMLLRVNNHVLIPRPETEELVAWVLTSIGENKSVLDVGTGSGCIAIALKKKKPSLQIAALDVSPAALDVARINATQQNVCIEFLEMDFLQKLPDQKFDCIVSNPPYIVQEEKAAMRENVWRYEPHIALFSDTVLLFYERLASTATVLLKDAGEIYVELNEYHADAIENCFRSVGITTTMKHDIHGKKRMLLAKI